MIPPPKISVVMTTYNRRRTLARSLASLFAQDLPAQQYEVIVVVDGSTDGTVKYLQELTPSCAFRVIEQANRGQGAAANVGFSAARGELILATDDDILCGPKNLSAHIAAHSRGERLVVHGPVFISSESEKSLATEWIRSAVAEEIERWQGPSRWPEDASFNANYSVARSALVGCGGYDAAFTRGRLNSDLGLVLWKMGFTFHYEPEAVAYHVYVKTADEAVRGDAWWQGRADLHLARKHKEIRRVFELANLADRPPLKQLARQLAAQSPVAPDLLLGPCFAIVEKLSWGRALRRMGIQFLMKRMRISHLRGARLEAGSWRALRREFGMSLPVLLYHHVGPSQPNTEEALTTSPAAFERQIRWLARHGYTGIRPSDWIAWLHEGQALPEKPILLTFDDAFADLCNHALPTLERHGFGAGVFVVTQFVGKTNAWDADKGWQPLPCMTAQQIQEWSTRGIEFGAHTRTHRDLTALSCEEIAQEMTGSQRELMSIVGRPVRSFAYPYGEVNDAARTAGLGSFDISFTCDGGLNTLRTDPSLLRRTSVYPGNSCVDLMLQARWGWNPLERLRARVRLRSRLRRLARVGRKLWR